MLERLGVHGVLPFLSSGTGTSNVTKGLSKPDTGINSTEGDFYSTTVILPKEMALVLVLAQDSNTPVQQQTNTGRGGGGGGNHLNFLRGP